MGQVKPYILTIFNENNIWYLTYDWYESKNPHVLFIVDREFILHNSIYILENTDVINFKK
jgi:hypothetical protein